MPGGCRGWLSPLRLAPPHGAVQILADPVASVHHVSIEQPHRRATMRNIRQNLFFAFVYNALGGPVAAGVLYPVLGILLSPIIASAATTFSSVSVIGNALRLRRVCL